jgi:hypothetical protein
MGLGDRDDGWRIPDEVGERISRVLSPPEGAWIIAPSAAGGSQLIPTTLSRSRCRWRYISANTLACSLVWTRR